MLGPSDNELVIFLSVFSDSLCGLNFTCDSLDCEIKTTSTSIETEAILSEGSLDLEEGTNKKKQKTRF